MQNRKMNDNEGLGIFVIRDRKVSCLCLSHLRFKRGCLSQLIFIFMAKEGY